MADIFTELLCARANLAPFYWGPGFVIQNPRREVLGTNWSSCWPQCRALAPNFATLCSISGDSSLLRWYQVFADGNPRICEIPPISWRWMELGLDSFGNLSEFLFPYSVVLCIVIECLHVCVLVCFIFALNTLSTEMNARICHIHVCESWKASQKWYASGFYTLVDWFNVPVSKF